MQIQDMPDIVYHETLLLHILHISKVLHVKKDAAHIRPLIKLFANVTL